jgi:hypothetical protein
VFEISKFEFVMEFEVLVTRFQTNAEYG